MNVAELIEQLQALPPYYPVAVRAPDSEDDDETTECYLRPADADTGYLRGAGPYVIIDARERT